MKILHVIFSLNVGGSETLLVDILNEQCRTDRVELIVINRAYDQGLIRAINRNIRLHFVNRIPGSRLLNKIIRFNYLLLKIRPDIIHFHDQNAINIVAFKRAAKTCLTIHDVNKPVENLRKYDRLFSISEAVKQDILVRSNYQSRIIPNGIEFSKIGRKQKYEPVKPFRIVQVGRLFHEKKGQDILLKALSLLIHKYGLSDIQADFIGDGPSLDHLKSLAVVLRIAEHVTFHGVRDRDFIFRNLKNYDALIQPSMYEGFGISIIEAIAAGLPVAASDIDGPSEIMNGLPSGWLAEPGNPESLAAAIIDIYHSYQKRDMEERCKASYQSALNKYSISTTVKNYLTHYAAD